MLLQGVSPVILSQKLFIDTRAHRQLNLLLPRLWNLSYQDVICLAQMRHLVLGGKELLLNLLESRMLHDGLSSSYVPLPALPVDVLDLHVLCADHAIFQCLDGQGCFPWPRFGFLSASVNISRAIPRGALPSCYKPQARSLLFLVGSTGRLGRGALAATAKCGRHL